MAFSRRIPFNDQNRETAAMVEKWEQCFFCKFEYVCVPYAKGAILRVNLVTSKSFWELNCIDCRCEASPPFWLCIHCVRTITGEAANSYKMAAIHMNGLFAWMGFSNILIKSHAKVVFMFWQTTMTCIQMKSALGLPKAKCSNIYIKESASS